MAVAALVLGILSIVFAFVPYMSLLGGACGIVGIILAVLGKKDPQRAGMATAGLICSIIGTILCLIFYVACVGCVGCAIGMAQF